MLDIDRLIPANLQHDSVETRRKSRLIIYAVGIANLSSLLAAAMNFYLGESIPAQLVLLTLVPQTAIYLLFRISGSVFLAGHAFMALIFIELLIPYGVEISYAMLVVITLPIAATNLISARAGIAWTVIGALCVGVLAQLYFDAGELNRGLGFSIAIVTVVVGIAALIVELTRAQAVTEVAETNEKLLRQRDLIRQFVESTFPGIVQVDAQGLISVCQGINYLLGYPDELLRDRNIREFVHPEDISTVLSQIQEGADRGFHAEVRLRHQKGQWLWLEVFGIPDQNAQGVDQWLLAGRNIEDERRDRNHFLQTQRLESIGALAAGIAHDFNNLLMVISGFADLLPPGEERENILAAAEKAASLTADLSAFSRSGPTSKEVVDLETELRKLEMLKFNIGGQGHEVAVKYHGANLGVNLSPAQLNQVMTSIVTNATEASVAGSRIAIEVDALTLVGESARRLEVSPGNYAFISIADQGRGFSESGLAQAFDPFYTTKQDQPGAGLGLTIAFGIVRRMGGSIRIESNEQEGTRVSVYLPIAVMDESTAADDPVEVSEDVALLFVEDDPKIYDLLDKILNRECFQATGAKTGEEALKVIKDVAPALVITDIMMPGMRGTELADKIRENYPHIPILFISGYSDIDISDWFKSGDGPVKYLAKPFRPSELVSQIELLLAESRQ